MTKKITDRMDAVENAIDSIMKRVDYRLNYVEQSLRYLKGDMDKLKAQLAKGYYDPSVKPNTVVGEDDKLYELGITGGSPKELEPVTTVTEWMALDCHIEPRYGLIGVNEIYRTHIYTFKGLPDIDQIIANRLEKGALAIKVECTEKFDCKTGRWLDNSCYYWSPKIGHPRIHSWKRKGYWGWHNDGTKDIADSDIENHIRAYLEKQKPKEEVGVNPCHSCEYGAINPSYMPCSDCFGKLHHPNFKTRKENHEKYNDRDML